MASFNYFSGLFSGFGNNNNSFYTSLTDYSSIKTGSYKKLLKAHYSNSSEATSKILQNSNKNKDVYASKKYDYGKDKSLTSVKESADNLLKSSKDLYTSGNSGVFSKSKESDVRAGVKAFVEDYNELMDSTKKSTTKGVTSVADNLRNAVKAQSKALSKVGISVEDNGKLKIDDEVFDKADKNSLKSVFNGTDSVTFAAASKAATIGSYAMSAAKYTDSSLFDQYL